jgi:hypothetical protein
MNKSNLTVGPVMTSSWRRSSPAEHESDNRMRIRSCECVESIQEEHTSCWVVASLIFGHRSITVGEVKRRQTAAQDTSKLQPQKNMQQGSYRVESSPWSFYSGLRRRLMAEASSRSRYLAVIGERERQKSSDWAHPSPIPLAWKTQLLMRSFRDTRTASRWPAVMAPMNTGSRVSGATKITRGKE